MLILANQGKYTPRPDVAIFADTGDEPQWVYDTVEQMREWSSIPIEVVTEGTLSEHVRQRQSEERGRVANIPLFTMGGDGKAAPLLRQCSREYKVEPIEKHVGTLVGRKQGQRSNGILADCQIGISVDEAHRMRDSRTKWIRNQYPLIDLRLYRNQCADTCLEAGFSPKRSACVYCPYHSDRAWLDLKNNHPLEWDRAVQFDQDFRSIPGVRGECFVHRSLVPLDQVRFRHEHQASMFGNECEGMCGV